jgi:hypothetical protein
LAEEQRAKHSEIAGKTRRGFSLFLCTELEATTNVRLAGSEAVLSMLQPGEVVEQVRKPRLIRPQFRNHQVECLTIVLFCLEETPGVFEHDAEPVEGSRTKEGVRRLQPLSGGHRCMAVLLGLGVAAQEAE